MRVNHDKRTLDWRVKRVNPTKTPMVISLKCELGKIMVLGIVILQCLKNDEVVVERNSHTEGKSFHNGKR